MALAKLTDVQKLALDCYNKKIEKFSHEGKEIMAEDALRNEILGLVGGNWDYYSYQENKHKVFRLISEVLTVKMNELTQESFADFCEVRDYALGDKVEFTVKNDELFKVSNIADGKNSTRRQRLLGKKVPTVAYKMAVAIYEEFDRFIAGRIDFRELVDRAAASFQHEIAMQIANAIQTAYTNTHENLKVSSTYSDAELRKLIAKVKGATGQEVVIYGTPTALGNVEGAAALATLDDKRNYGYTKIFDGVQMLELPQTYNVEADEFGIKDDVLLVLPVGEKIVKLGFEGDLMTIENTDGTVRDDQQIEFFMQRKMHLGVLVASRFGAYEIV